MLATQFLIYGRRYPQDPYSPRTLSGLSRKSEHRNPVTRWSVVSPCVALWKFAYSRSPCVVSPCAPLCRRSVLRDLAWPCVTVAAQAIGGILFAGLLLGCRSRQAVGLVQAQFSA